MPATNAVSTPSAVVQIRTTERLDGLADRPVTEHVAVFDEVHRALQDALATLDQA